MAASSSWKGSDYAALGANANSRRPAVVLAAWRPLNGGDILDEASAVAAYERHNTHVRATAPPDRLLEWHPGDGWEPICEALGVDVPDEPFPHVNTTEEFRAMLGLEGGAA
jgi:Sulfotransferase domain